MARNDGLDYRTSVVLCVLCFVVCLLSVLVICFRTIKVRHDFVLTRDNFERAVFAGAYSAVSNLLISMNVVETNSTSLVLDASQSRETTDPLKSESIEYSFWIDIRKRPYLLIEGVEYTVGDLYRNSLIVQADERRFICVSPFDRSLLIVRNCRGGGRAAQSPSDGAADDARDESVTSTWL